MMGFGKGWVKDMALIMVMLAATVLILVIFASGCAAIQKGLTYHVVEAVADRLQIPQQGVTLEEMIKGLGASTATLAAGYLGLKLRGRK